MKARDEVHLAGVDTKLKTRNNIRSAYVDPTPGSYSTRSNVFGIPKLADHTNAFHARLLPHTYSNIEKTGSRAVRGLKPVLSVFLRVKSHKPLCDGANSNHVGATQIESHFFCKPGSASAQIKKIIWSITLLILELANNIRQAQNMMVNARLVEELNIWSEMLLVELGDTFSNAPTNPQKKNNDGFGHTCEYGNWKWFCGSDSWLQKRDGIFHKFAVHSCPTRIATIIVVWICSSSIPSWCTPEGRGLGKYMGYFWGLHLFEIKTSFSDEWSLQALIFWCLRFRDGHVFPSVIH